MKPVIVIAAYNEEATIYKTIKEAIGYAPIIVIDDGSRDKTAELAKAAGAKVFSQENKGYDAALNEGFVKANELQYTHVLTLDADGQHPAERIPDFLSQLENGYDLVIGKRQYKQRIAEYLFAVYMYCRFGVVDPICGMKAYNLDYYKQLGFFDSYKSTGTELMIRYMKKKLKYCQQDIVIKRRIDEPRFGMKFGPNMYILKSMINGILKT